jgi:glutamine amidotransferase/cyclase
MQAVEDGTLAQTSSLSVDQVEPAPSTMTLVKRIVVALDVRTNDHGDLVVTKGDQYDVRENEKEGIKDGERGNVRNLGKPVALARRYYEEGADEIAFLNITSYRQGVIEDMPMLRVLEEASKNIFVPLTVGGGIRSYTDPASNQTWSALEVASRYFRAGADKVRPLLLLLSCSPLRAPL